MTEHENTMPRNIVGAGTGGTQTPGGVLPEISEEEWRAENLPAEKLVLRWRYANKEIQLYERRLRSLRAYNVGPAVQAWVRSRLEWVRDNKLYERPDGMIVLSIDPEGDVDIQLEAAQDAPQFAEGDLLWEGDVLAGCTVPGTVWVLAPQGAKAVPQGTPELRDAADTLARDLLKTLGHPCYEGAVTHGFVDGAELCLASDEFGIVPCEGKCADGVAKLQECFDKLWAAK